MDAAPEPREAGRSEESSGAWGDDSDGCLAVLRGHGAAVEGAVFLDDGRALSWSEDGTLRAWGDDGVCVVFAGHRGAVHGALALPGGRALSWSEDGTLRAWGGDGVRGV
jgi:WD40 repeat protein